MTDRWKVSRQKMDPFLWLSLLLVGCLAVLLIWTVWRIPRPLPNLAQDASSHLAASGVDNPVTAVLLNFRGYDTLLEVMVLLLGGVTVWSITHAPFPSRVPDLSAVQIGAVRILTPLIILIAAYLIWQGAYQTGGAFQGGAVLSAALVLLQISDFRWLPRVHFLPLRLGLTLGPLVFLAIAMWCIASQGALLMLPPDRAGALLLAVETACGISIGLTLAAFFVGGRPAGDLRELPYTKELDAEEDEEEDEAT